MARQPKKASCARTSDRSQGASHKPGPRPHPAQVARLTRRAKARLAEINQDDVSELFSLRLTATTRIYGIRDRQALKLLWYDPHHGTNAHAVYPVRNR